MEVPTHHRSLALPFSFDCSGVKGSKLLWTLLQPSCVNFLFWCSPHKVVEQKMRNRSLIKLAKFDCILPDFQTSSVTEVLE